MQKTRMTVPSKPINVTKLYCRKNGKVEIIAAMNRQKDYPCCICCSWNGDMEASHFTPHRVMSEIQDRFLCWNSSAAPLFRPQIPPKMLAFITAPRKKRAKREVTLGPVIASLKKGNGKTSAAVSRKGGSGPPQAAGNCIAEHHIPLQQGSACPQNIELQTLLLLIHLSPWRKQSLWSKQNRNPKPQAPENPRKRLDLDFSGIFLCLCRYFQQTLVLCLLPPNV